MEAEGLQGFYFTIFYSKGWHWAEMEFSVKCAENKSHGIFFFFYVLACLNQTPDLLAP
jgi:hypothetical protein